jgi:hypothetical protein
LESVHRRYFIGHAELRVWSTPLLEHVPDQVLLAVVGGEDGDLACGVPYQAHVLQNRGGGVLGGGVVEEEWCWSPLEEWCWSPLERVERLTRHL